MKEPDKYYKTDYTQEIKYPARIQKSELFKGKAYYLQQKTVRQKFLLPIVVSVIVLIFIISPSVTAILQIISMVNPIIWAVALLIAIYFWRKYVG